MWVSILQEIIWKKVKYMNLIDSLAFLKKLNINEDILIKKITPQLQFLALELMRPEHSKMEIWQCEKDGKKKFRKHLEAFFKEDLSSDFVNFAWEYFKLNKITNRSCQVKLEFSRKLKGNYICNHCGINEGDFEIDHIIPLSLGGKDESRNLQVLCKICNREKSNQFDFKKNIFITLFN